MSNNISQSDKNSTKNFELLYSPRTKYSKELEYEEQLFKDLTLNFDPITIKIIKKHFKERLGSLNKIEFISILKNHLLSWHPELPNREIMLIKLLGRLFSEVDLNDNGDMEWAEFTNYIIHNSNSTNKQSNKNNPYYRLRYYYPTKIKLDLDLSKDVISHAFYIEKFNLLGICQEGRSYIIFFECKNFKRLKSFIDLKDIQKEIDDLEIKELNVRSEEMLQKEIKEREEKMAKQRMTLKKFFEPIKTSTQFTRKYEKPWIINKKKLMTTSSNFYSTSNNFNSNKTFTVFPQIYNRKKIEKEKTPEKLKRELEKIKHEQIITKINKKLSIITTVFINEFDVLLISTTNNKICAWQYLNGEFKNVNAKNDFRIEKNYFKCSILSAEFPQNTMSWDPIQKYLYTGQNDGKILKWELSKPKPLEKEELDFDKAKNRKEEDLHNNNNKNFDKEEQNLERKFLLNQKGRENNKLEENLQNFDKKNQKSVSCLLLLGKLQLLAASYYNGNIILWDPLLKDFRKFYFDQDTGVYSMSYDSIKNLLITAGFAHDIYIYDPYIDNSCIYKLTGHSSSLNTIISNEKESEILSLDILGSIKIWDSQNFLCFQNINLNETMELKQNDPHNNNRGKKKISSNLKMLYIQKIKKFFVYGKKNVIFETDKAQNPDLADDQLILACFYEKITKTIISFCLKKIKIWNIFTGKVKNVYEDPMNNEITALTIDRNIKRAFLGDCSGHIRNLNMKNGKILKDLEPHNTEIKFLTHSLTLNIVVSCSIDNYIKIHDDTELTESEVKKELYIQNGNVKAIAICDLNSRLAIGLSTGNIKFYDIEHFRFDSDVNSDINAKTFDEVTCIAPIQEAEIIFSAHASGKCKFMITPPSAMKFYEIFSFNINEEEGNNNNNNKRNSFMNFDGHKKISIFSIEIDEENKRMFLGDQLGILRCYNIEEIYDLIDYGINKRKNENEPIITLEVYQQFRNIKIPLIWKIEAHKELIKHIMHVNIEPKIVITTSNDLKIKIFSAETGKFKDELRQVASKYKPIPIGIKYKITNPFQSKNEQTQEEHILLRKDLDSLKNENLEEIENQQIGEYSKQITKYNAKEKLWQAVKGIKLKDNQSNKWDLDIDVEKVKENERNELEKIIEIVKQKEGLIKQTEMLMQTKSIYSDEYKPQFVGDMDEEELEDFSNVLSQKLRQVKLAISKANLGQNKYANFEEEQKKKEQISKKFHEIIKYGFNEKKVKSPVLKKEIKSQYAYLRQKYITPEQKFKKFNQDCIDGIEEAKKEFQRLQKRTKVKIDNDEIENKLSKKRILPQLQFDDDDVNDY